jgi:hypothetical protein
MRASYVAEVLAQLIAAGRVIRSDDGYRINQAPPLPLPGFL